MKAKKMMRPIAMAACMLALEEAHTQTSVLGNNPGSPGTDYVGWDNNTTVPLMVRHNANQPIDWYTAAIQRMRLNGNVTGPIGPTPALQFPNINRDGFFLLSGTADAFTNAGCNAPFTRLHLVDNAVNPNDPVAYAQQHGFRPWQRNGITFTGNSDQSYIGHRYAGNDNTDFVIQWSDNPNGSPWGTDRMRFVFTTQYNPASSRGATSVDGLEAIRLWPRNSSEVNLGIGDFFAGNQLTPATVVDPTERVDILNGRLRIRQLPDDPAAVDSFYVMVVDRTALTANNQQRGVVRWVDPAIFGGGGGADCDWDVQPTANRMTTATAAVGSSASCPERDWLVGIGAAQPTFKLDVRHSDADAAVSGGIQAYLEAGSSSSAAAMYAEVAPIGNGSVSSPTGVRGRVSGVDYIGRGVLGEAVAGPSDGNTLRTIGVEGTSTGPASGTLTEALGVSGKVQAQSNGAITFASGAYGEVKADGVLSHGSAVEGFIWGQGASVQRHGFKGLVYGSGVTTTTYGVRAFANGGTAANYGVYAEAGNDAASNWSGWFGGDIWVQNTGFFTNGTATISDENLKTGIAAVEGALEKVLQLEPSTYQFNSAAYPMMDLSDAPQIGLLAQDVEEVVPEAVVTTLYPAQYDDQGNLTSEAFPVKAIDYNKLIPLLIGAIKEQQSSLTAVQQQLAAMQQQLAACCTAPPTDSDQRMLHGSGSGMDTEGQPTPAQERLLRIAPNPFTDRTTLYCTLERAGRMQLLVNSSDGRDLRVLAEGQREAGEFQYEWRTEHLAPGVYYMTLLLDGEPLVKRAVKVRE